MKTLTDDPLFSTSSGDVTRFLSERASVLFVGPAKEDRTSAWNSVRSTAPHRIVEISETDERTVATVTTPSTSGQLQLRNPDMVRALILDAGTDLIDIDITSLATHIWAPLIKTCWDLNVQTRAVYVEPGDYAQSQNPTESQLFDLSDRIAGIEALPGFASIRRVSDEDSLFVPLLGFEGARLAFIVDSVEPRDENIFPIVGIPGFRPSYPFHTYLGNQSTFLETGAWRNVFYSRANCPFSAFYCINLIASKRPDHFIKLAPIGTKPHCLGAVLFYLANSDRVELVYDHPRRKDGRTKGVSNVCVYDVAAFRDFLGASSVTGRPV